MFVKRDLRKIPEIINLSNNNDDESDVLTELKLARRQGEFLGNLNVLCDPIYAQKFRNLTNLSLYDCGLHDLRGIGMLGDCSRVQKLNLGHNDFTEIPPDFALLADTLEVLWLDDCQLHGPLPECIYQLVNLKELRMSGNQISEVRAGNVVDVGLDEDDDEDMEEDGLSALKLLEVLCLDNNNLTTIPNDILLPKLQSLMIRQNQISQVPEMSMKQMPSLRVLQISSNSLNRLPSSITTCHTLEEIYVNGNALKKLPSCIDRLEKVKVLNACDNQIQVLPSGFIDRFGRPDIKTGNCSKVSERCINCNFSFELNCK